ncbi:MAG: response regulator, partial [Pseudomonadota bacterium]
GHKGSIQIYSEPEKGSTFRVLLPAGEMGGEYVSPGLQESDFQGHGTVLLVDDEDFIRDIGKEMLQSLGFSVITASDGNEALEAFRSNPDVSCIILDYTMPHMDGLQCFNELRQLDPNVNVIMSSGYSEQEITSKLHGQLLTGFIQKPFTLSSLRDVLLDLGDLRKIPV